MSDPYQNHQKNTFGRSGDEARKLFAYLLLACKNLSLYPEGHVTGVNSVRHFYARLTEYTRQYGDFRIEIDRNRVVCAAKEVYAGTSDEGTLPFTLFRDGIRWLEFQKGATLEEVSEVLSIINRYSVLSAEPEGDIVTAFWECRFETIRYEVADLYFGLSPEQTATVSAFNPGPPQGPSSPEQTQKPDIDAAIDPAVLELSPEEHKELKKMVHDEETADSSAHLRMLLDSLLFYKEDTDLKIVLDVLEKEFTVFLFRSEYGSALIIAEGLHYLLERGRILPHLKPLIGDFFFAVSSPGTLKPVREAWPYLSLPQARILARLFYIQHPRTLETLIEMIVVHQPPQYEQLLEDVMIALVGRDRAIMKSLLDVVDDRIVARLIPVFARLDKEEAEELFLAVCRRPSVFVRRLALRALFRIVQIPAGKIFDLIHDEDAEVRRLILRQLGRKRDEEAEALLLTYLRDKRITEVNHLLACYQTLGKCGTQRSVGFLRKKLMHRKWYPAEGRLPERQGAALALLGLDNSEAQQVIESAQKSIFPWIRKLFAGTAGPRQLRKGEM